MLANTGVKWYILFSLVIKEGGGMGKWREGNAGLLGFGHEILLFDFFISSILKNNQAIK